MGIVSFPSVWFKIILLCLSFIFFCVWGSMYYVYHIVLQDVAPLCCRKVAPKKEIICNPCIKSILRIFSSDQTNAQTISFRRIPALIYLKTKNIEEKSWKILLNFIDFLKLMMWDMLLAFQPELLSTKILLNLKMTKTFYLKPGDFSIVLI